MSIESNAYSHARDFHWRLGDTSISNELANIHDAQALLKAAKDRLQIDVDNARFAGCTWEQIGDVFGITKQSAVGRFGKGFSIGR